jgi:ATP-dependent protease HslVU (ClpYQ) peptidase subunit
MTTIAARAGVIAGDGRETDDDTVVSKTARKVFKLPDGRIVGLSGQTDLMHQLLQALKHKHPTPVLGDKVGALMYDLKGKLWLYEGVMWMRADREYPYYAIGSGRCYALAAMHAGADAVKACKIGAEMDPFSGGLVRHVALKKSSVARR